MARLPARREERRVRLVTTASDSDPCRFPTREPALRLQGRGDDNLGDAAYYSYTAPEPDGLREQPLSGGAWTESGSGSLAILPYETVRTARHPRTTLLAFCQSAYEAGARLAGWDTSSFESTWCPTPSQLRELYANAAADLGRRTEQA